MDNTVKNEIILYVPPAKEDANDYDNLALSQRIDAYFINRKAFLIKHIIVFALFFFISVNLCIKDCLFSYYIKAIISTYRSTIIVTLIFSILLGITVWGSSISLILNLFSSVYLGSYLQNRLYSSASIYESICGFAFTALFAFASILLIIELNEASILFRNRGYKSLNKYLFTYFSIYSVAIYLIARTIL